MTIDGAAKLYDDGVLCVPAQNKVPVLPYSHWYDAAPGKDEYLTMWSNYQGYESHVLCGLMCAIDVDMKNDPDGAIVSKFEGDLTEFCPEIFESLYIEQTASGGRHYFFYSTTPFPSENLAFLDNATFDDMLNGKSSWKPVIEYRGYHGLCRCFPSPGIAVIRNSIETAPRLHDHEVSLIRYLAKELNQKPEEKITDEPRVERVVSDTPGNDYSSRAPLSEVCDMLERHGWTCKQRGGRVYLRRPGARTKGFDADIKGRVFKCYSGSVSEFKTGEAYSLWRAYAILEHGGDYKSAAKSLSEMGYGSETNVVVRSTYLEPGRFQQNTDQPAEYTEEDLIWESLKKNTVKLSQPPKDVEFILHWTEKKGFVENKYGVAAPGMMMVVSGPPKARKSSVVTSMIASSICKSHRCGFLLMIDPEDEIVILDTEQPDMYSYQYARRIAIQGGVRELPNNVTIYKQRAMSVASRRKSLDVITKKHPRLRVLVIDGIKDMLHDYVGDNKESDSLISDLMKISSGLDQKVLIVLVLHLNKGDGKLRGAIGTELENKGDVRIECRLMDDDSTQVSFPITRDRKPPAFTFTVVGPNIPVPDGWPDIKYDFTIGAIGAKEENQPPSGDHLLPDYIPAHMPMPRHEEDANMYLPVDLGITEEEWESP